MLWVRHASTNAPLFPTGWFVESLATQTLVVFVIRTAGNPFRSRLSRPLLMSVIAVVAIAGVLPYTPLVIPSPARAPLRGGRPVPRGVGVGGVGRENGLRAEPGPGRRRSGRGGAPT